MIILSIRKKIMNTLLVIGICFLTIGFLLVIVSEMMISHYDRKLYQLEKRRKEALGVRK